EFSVDLLYAMIRDDALLVFRRWHFALNDDWLDSVLTFLDRHNFLSIMVRQLDNLSISLKIEILHILKKLLSDFSKESANYPEEKSTALKEKARLLSEKKGALL